MDIIFHTIQNIHYYTWTFSHKILKNQSIVIHRVFVRKKFNILIKGVLYLLIKWASKCSNCIGAFIG